MIVVLPTGEKRPVPETCRDGKELKRYIETQEQIPSALQRLLVGGRELGDDESCAAQDLPGVACIDLVVDVGSRWTLCRELLREHLPGANILSPPATPSSERDIERLEPQAVRFFDVNDLFCEREELAESFRANAAPFYDAYTSRSMERLAELDTMRERLEPGPVVALTFNEGFGELFRNWLASCEEHAIDPRSFSLAFPMDSGAAALARSLGFQTYFDGESYGDLPREAVAVYGDGDFARCMFAKTAVVQDLLHLGCDVLFQDVDVVWKRDPRRYLIDRARQHSLDFQFMYDGLNQRFQPLFYNTGFFYVDNNEVSRCAWTLVFERFAEVMAYRSQQVVVNIVMNNLGGRGLRSEQLAESLFVNGNAVPLAPDANTSLPSELFVVHASWTHNIDFKLEKLRANGLWFLD